MKNFIKISVLFFSTTSMWAQNLLQNELGSLLEMLKKEPAFSENEETYVHTTYAQENNKLLLKYNVCKKDMSECCTLKGSITLISGQDAFDKATKLKQAFEAYINAQTQKENTTIEESTACPTQIEPDAQMLSENN